MADFQGSSKAEVPGEVNAGGDRISSTETEPKLNSLPNGFKAEASGISRRETTAGSAPKWVPLCSPIRVLALTRDDEDVNWGRLIELTNPDRRVKQWAIPARMFAGDGVDLLASLFDRGLVLYDTSRSGRRAIIDLLQKWRPSPRVLSADRLGWTADRQAFILGDGRVFGGVSAVYQTHAAPGAASEIREVGTLADWRSCVAAKCVSNPVLMFSVATALAGPLLEPLEIEGGGFHLMGESSRGKSTALRIAGSVWGSAQFVQTWRATSNGIEGVAATCNSTLLCLDEMGQVSGREVGEVVYMLANGRGKVRADRSGGARRPATWRVMFLSSGEISLADKMAEAGLKAKAGHDVRIINISATERMHGAFDDLHGAVDGRSFAVAANQAAAGAFGSAGPAFVQRLMDEGEAAMVSARGYIDAFRTRATDSLSLADADGQVHRVVDRFALVAAAGELASLWDITGWPLEAANNAALTLLASWLARRGGNGAAEAKDASKRVAAYISIHGASRFQLIGGPDNVVHNRAGWRTETHYFISSAVWREIHAGSDPTRAARHLLGAGLLVPGDGNNLMQRLGHAVPGRPRAYRIPAQILGEGGDG